MKRKLSGILTLLLVLVVQIAFAQQEKQTVRGTVTDNEGLPLPGVNIVVKGTQVGTQTDFDGKYSILAGSNDVLVFSYLGFLKVEQRVGNATVIDATLSPDAAELEEVVVMGYVSRGANELTGSSVQVRGEEVAEVPLVSADQALQGKVAGLQISASSGTPGSTQDVRIRGISSLNASNEPLYVIDGVPVNNSNIAGSNDSSSLNPLSSINSQDIASITVLKDASATAAYGARGSNGVIVITTKRGADGEVKFNFTSSIGVQNDAYNKRKPLTGPQRIDLLRESLVNAYSEFGFTYDNALQLGVDNELLSPAILEYGGEIYNWSEAIKNEDALLQNYTLSASGGDEKGSFYASVGYNETEATVIGAAFKRLSGALSVEKEFRDNLDFSSSINLSHTTSNPILELGTFFSNPFITRYLMNPLNPIYNDEGELNIDLPFGSLHNTLYVTDNDISKNALTRGIFNNKLDWELVDNLTFSNRISLDFQLNDYKSYGNRHEGSAAPVNGWSERSTEQNFNWVYQGSLNYNFQVDVDHNFDITGLFEYQHNQNSYLYGYGENFPADGLTNIASASANFDATSEYTDWYNVSYLALFNYNYARKYVLDATYRREGSSRFAEGNRFGNFGSLGAAWNIHMEDFMSESVFNTLRLRTSYGITGNSGVDLNAYQALLDFGAAYNSRGGAVPSQFGNADLTWEKGEAFDIGMSFGVWNNRLEGSVSYFKRRTYDLLQEVPLSLTTGFELQNRNVGEMINDGVEAELSFLIFSTKDFNWNVSANYATVENEVTELALGADGNPLNPLAGSSYKTTQVGLPVAAWYMPTWAGVDVQTGAPTWYLNGVDGEVTNNYSSAERVYQNASALPTYSGGLGTRISYKGIFAEANLYFAGGHKIYEQYAQFYMTPSSFALGSYNGVQELMERWQQPGDVTDVPALIYNSSRSFQSTSSRHLFDGDYVRLRNVAIGYTFPASYAEAIGIDGLSLSLRGTNVATWVKDDGLKLDPEVQAIGYTSLTTPPVESYTFGVNLKF
ncbi:SusC/RagA family TonB-linked outer membrane protein [Salinimicrobium sp. TIG7-5_MAKvit]|uniref:SusC/RagA family TonB-linked outer membrane protein n=1 Tax=Salinimicrobium sp. TIG7-5_MAKvit TaxID=3121289 RepID=UPI003C6E13BB